MEGLTVKRAYHQHCGLAAAMDVLGERWTLLLVRELLLGPRRYSELLADLPGLGTNLLADRLRFLVARGVVRQCGVGSAQRYAYELTDTGHGLRPVLLELTRWGLFRPELSTVDTVRPRWAFLAVEALAAGRHAEVDEDYEFRVDGEVFHLSVRAGRAHGGLGPAQPPSVVATTDAGTLLVVCAQPTALTEATHAGRLELTGTDSAVRRCTALLTPS
ncbi:helix-turn-helix domain-containing protein [Kutzneria viridogrisea]|uniref:HTH hxlR-type domain-containing protein n=2 Tax=Kutzneria TaxID=43356 RepID=W5W7G9_9PSEU|nr:helix-turn-helix domain-containing protein [Kutzneria albida]AHH96877.1 hypothetical protein KALB_3513 [Kutzneria albida DSM 43870]MBA8927900.1 DNA-binding HxlR family transcriptional regulator [Kutzneria viridogrisea]